MNGCRRRRASFVRAETGFNEDKCSSSSSSSSSSAAAAAVEEIRCRIPENSDVTNEVIISGFLCETGLLEKIFTQEEELDFVR
ncbi:hypothetical protein F2P81_015766 [Scophthalmus maximus]|uniref:Uncharacterized protein n=1 Tax=Scophthalmus maximus TaxID=52904 RepID=A0A6A4SJA9_SCOMX|nr:hypothetical protein F2P81_015766 [Scophthalmus maximus]